jgi:hypothetical protein
MDSERKHRQQKFPRNHLKINKTEIPYLFFSQHSDVSLLYNEESRNVIRYVVL